MTENPKREKLPAVELRKKGGRWLPHFYARIYLNGVSKVKNTRVRWRGTPPEFLRDAGDEDFEPSRTEAEKVAEGLRKETAEIGEASEQKEFLIAARTGERAKDLAISKLPDLLKSIEHRRARSKSWENWKVRVVSDFAAWARYHKVKTAFGVTRKTVRQYMDHLLLPDDFGRIRTAKTVGDIKMILGNLFEEALTARGASKMVISPFATHFPCDGGNTLRNAQPFSLQSKERNVCSQYHVPANTWASFTCRQMWFIARML